MAIFIVKVRTKITKKVAGNEISNLIKKAKWPTQTHKMHRQKPFDKHFNINCSNTDSLNSRYFYLFVRIVEKTDCNKLLCIATRFLLGSTDHPPLNWINIG